MTDSTQTGSDNRVTRKHSLTGVEAEKIKGTQELDEILDEFLTDIYMNNEHFAANQEALDKTKEEPMQAILDWHNKQIEAELRSLLDAKYIIDGYDATVRGIIPRSAIEAKIEGLSND